MNFTNDEEAKAYVNNQLEILRFLRNGPYYAFIRPQWRYRDLPSNKLDLGHLWL